LQGWPACPTVRNKSKKNIGRKGPTSHDEDNTYTGIDYMHRKILCLGCVAFPMADRLRRLFSNPNEKI
jgi:hypothetical protein